MNSKKRNLSVLARRALDQQLKPLRTMESLIRPEGEMRAIHESIG
jgi:hypothetical protein